MHFEETLLEGTLVRRYKRFFADVELASGEVVVAHCANPGSMRNCAVEGAPVWLSQSDNPRRKLRYTWELVRIDDATICVNTSRANTVVEGALKAGVVSELENFDELRREVKYGVSSRIDFLLRCGEARTYVEVKSVTLGMGDNVSAFPDSVTTRGTKHVNELMAMTEEGHRSVMLFCCNRSDTRVMRPADEIDPVYGKALREAAAAGVELLAYRCHIDPTGVWMRERIPISLDEACV